MAAQAATTLTTAQDAYGDATRAVAGLQSQWDACVAEANKLHGELATAATATATAIRGIEAPPAVPGQAAGGASGSGLPSMTCRPIPDPGADGNGGDPGPPPEPQPEEDSGWGTKILDGGQTILDVAGLIPGVGEIADGTNALIYLARGDKVNATLSGAAMIPFAGWGATGTKFAVKGAKAFDAAKATRGWKVGDDVYAKTMVGKDPSWSTVRRRFWKNEGADPQIDDWSSANIDRMNSGRAPQRYNPDKGGIESMELSHEPIPFRDGGRDFVPRWPQDHAAVDPFRRPGY